MQDPFRHLRAASRTHCGRVREQNEDAMLALPAQGLFAVADGMGGCRGGDVAAQAVIDHLRAAVDDPPLPLATRVHRFREAIDEASDWIRRYAARHGNPGMGSTVAVLVMDPETPHQAAVLHAGDSRVYRLRGGRLEALTRDHSVAAMAGLVASQPVPSLFQGVITRAVGMRRDVGTETRFLDVQRADRFLLCSDGVHGLIPHDRMERLVNENPDPNAAAEALLDAALAAGGDDNASLILVEMETRSDPPPRLRMPYRASSPHPRPPGRFPWLSLMALLGVGLLGLFGIWSARDVPPDLPAASAPAAGAASVPDPRPVSTEPSRLPAPDAAVTPALPAPAEPRSESPAAAWAREREAIVDQPDRLRLRHAAVVAAYARLEAWSGEPAPAPSFMRAGRPEERADAWLQFLRQAQAGWMEACRTRLARLQAEAACLTPARLTGLCRWTAGSGRLSETALPRLLADREAWCAALDRTAAWLAQTDPGLPFLHQFPDEALDAFPGAADRADAVWREALSEIGRVWRFRDFWLTRDPPPDPAAVDETIRLSNALWAEFTAAGFQVRPWRGRLSLAAAEAALARFDRWPEEGE